MPLRPSIPGTSPIALHSVMRSILCTARLSTFTLLYCLSTVDYALRSLTQDSAAQFPFLTALHSIRSTHSSLWTSFWFHVMLFHFFSTLRSIPQFSAAFDSILHLCTAAFTQLRAAFSFFFLFLSAALRSFSSILPASDPYRCRQHSHGSVV